MKDIISMLIEKDLLVVVILGIIVILFLLLFVVLILTDKNIYQDDNIEMLNIKKNNNEKNNEEIKQEEKIEEKEFDDENTSDIADVLATMQANLEDRTQKTISDFEQEQEENAIISYQELVIACQKNKEKEQKNEETIEEQIEEKIDEKQVVEKTEPVKKFKKSEFISPIYGKEKKKEENISSINSESKEQSYDSNVSFEQKFDLEELQNKMKDNEEFLEELKNFRNSL